MPKDSSGYRATLNALRDYFKQIELPVRSVQYDSWWYYKGPHSGIMLWEPVRLPASLRTIQLSMYRGSNPAHRLLANGVGQEPSTLGGDAVDGPPSSWYKFGLPTVTHSRFYEPANDYVTGKAPDLPPNASSWTWINASTATVSSSAEFFEHIFGRAQQGMGMVTYEQDFLTKSYESIPALQSELGLAKAWLSAMSHGAQATNVTLQYCMALPRHILQSASFPRVTHAR